MIYHFSFADWEEAEKAWEAIKAKYPDINFKTSIGDGTGVGWWALLEKAFADISAVMHSNPGMKFDVMQIKEKFGGLRFYCHVGRKEECELTQEKFEEARSQIYEIVDSSERAANSTCEVCGEPGKRRNTRWIKTLCDAHTPPDSED